MKETLLMAVALVVGIFIGFVLFGGQMPIGSITTGQEYYATSTVDYGIRTDQTIRTGWGSLGSVTVTGAGDMEYILYDATSTSAIITDTRITSSTQLLAVIPASLAAGTYVFDATFTTGLAIDVISGTQTTSTITYR